ncbi:haloperoxidase [Reichenbachiella sp. 5M10]|uniref:vanadium-dependent haloperoxidase n=1 Tax=Reichenbachiella sp. 5M10 TaxID=1889772 RepID=UPI000C15AACF|nr:vanadium-dependent haloperoxidase [Reichenbachiella sp. 5M10]PIB37490.1 haloperoxidase [Reichenbachiella sp. 5M10]
MKRQILMVLCVALMMTGCDTKQDQTEAYDPIGRDNVAYKWGEIALKATANDTDMFKPRPTITSRFLGLIFTAVFDAWTRYDEKASPVYLTGVERRPSIELTTRNKEIAISYAAYRAMSEYYYSDSTMYREYMLSLGLDPSDESLDPTTPVGIGNLAAKAVIASRRNDGSNQYGELSPDGKPYYDYTQYSPVNSVEENVALQRWQPKYFADGKGGKFAPSCLTPYWQLVKPLMLDSSSQYRPAPPPAVGSEQLALEVKEVIDLQANLTDENRALVEFMRDGPQSVQQAGHWLNFAQQVSLRDHHTLDEDVKMYFYVEAVAMDGFIACWDSKMYYDFARPFALVHDYYRDQTITAWGGPDVGMTQMKGEEWRPYSPSTFLCPPFPSYVSGHSTISGGCAEALRLFTGSDEFGSSVELIPGSMTEPNNLGEKVTLHFPTFTQAGEMAGISRVMGGYHIQADNVEGLNLGRNVAQDIWKKYQKLLGEEDTMSQVQAGL